MTILSDFLLWQFIYLPLALAVIYPAWALSTRFNIVPLQWASGLFGYLLDVYLNFTTFALLTWDAPRYHEWTFSTRIKYRLKYREDWRGKLLQPLVKFLNFWMPGHV
jgi:hypothetical protein